MDKNAENQAAGVSADSQNLEIVPGDPENLPTKVDPNAEKLDNKGGNNRAPYTMQSRKIDPVAYANALKLASTANPADPQALKNLGEEIPEEGDEERVGPTHMEACSVLHNSL